MFKAGDIVQAKKEWLAPYETQEDTKGIVVDYNPDNDYLQIGVLNPQDYALPPIFNGRGCYYEVVKPDMKVYRKLTLEERKKTFDNYQALCAEHSELTPFEDFDQYDREQEKLDLVFDAETLECLG